MTRDEVLAELRKWAGPQHDPEIAHTRADDLLLELVDDEVREAWRAVTRWYS